MGKMGISQITTQTYVEIKNVVSAMKVDDREQQKHPSWEPELGVR